MSSPGSKNGEITSLQEAFQAAKLSQEGWQFECQGYTIVGQGTGPIVREIGFYTFIIRLPWIYGVFPFKIYIYIIRSMRWDDRGIEQL